MGGLLLLSPVAFDLRRLVALVLIHYRYLLLLLGPRRSPLAVVPSLAWVLRMSVIRSLSRRACFLSVAPVASWVPRSPCGLRLLGSALAARSRSLHSWPACLAL